MQRLRGRALVSTFLHGGIVVTRHLGVTLQNVDRSFPLPTMIASRRAAVTPDARNVALAIARPASHVALEKKIPPKLRQNKKWNFQLKPLTYVKVTHRNINLDNDWSRCFIQNAITDCA